MNSQSSKNLSCSISLDLDNQWSYMKIHGDNGWKNYPSYLNTFVPYVIKILKDLDLKITFFVVGKDADIKENTPALESISGHNHEIGNHSYNHESWLHLYTKEQIRSEVLKAEEAIINATGQKPVGFRGPGFSWSYNLFEVLSESGYLFDASTLPTFIGPLARMYYFKKSDLSKEEKKDRKELFGKFSDGFRPLKPYYWDLKENRRLLEIPVSTIPLFKIPFHLSYLIYLNNISPVIMKAYLRTAINLCKITKTEPSFLLHPLDLIGGDQIKDLAFFPGMNVSSKYKTKLFIEIINEIKKNFSIVNMRTFANRLSSGKDIKQKFFTNRIYTKYNR